VQVLVLSSVSEKLKTSFVILSEVRAADEVEGPAVQLPDPLTQRVTNICDTTQFMALTQDFRGTVQARVQKDAKFRRGLLRDAIDALLAGETALGREILRDFINATIGFPELSERTGIHVKSLHQMFGPKGNPTAANLFNIIAALQEYEGVKLQVVA
jgi:DNA-binding phage protein